MTDQRDPPDRGPDPPPLPAGHRPDRRRRLPGRLRLVRRLAASAGCAPAGDGTPTGPLKFANWDAYIDLTEVGDGEYDLPSPTLDEFTAEYGVEVDYANAQIEDNESFMATIRPQLESGVDDRLGHHRPDRLDGGQGRRGRLGGGDRPGQRPRRPRPTSATSSRACRGTRT